MTEESYQKGKKVMQTARDFLYMIEKSKTSIVKWTNLEDYHRREFHEDQANSCKNCIEKAIIRLENWRKKFADLKFPE